MADAAPSRTFSESAPRPIADMFASMYGAGVTPRVGRAEALSVPAVLRGRNLICSVGALPLVQYGPDSKAVRNPLLEQVDPDVANVVTLEQTVEDLLFDAVAWWRITQFGFDKYPMSAQRVAPSRVSTTPPGGSARVLPSGMNPDHGVVWIDGKPVEAQWIIRFDSPNPAVLAVAGRAIRRAVLLDKAASMYADNPRPLDYFTPVDGADPADDDEIAEILSEWGAARRARSTAYVPAALAYNSVSQPTPQELQLVELQRQAWLEIANALGVDPEEIGVSTTSRTYANVNDRRRDRINDVLNPYMRAVTDRLSMPDVTKRGHRVAFDLADYMKANETERATVYKTYLDMGAITVDEIRAKEGLPPLPPSAKPKPAPTPAETPAVEDVDASAPAAVTFDADSTRTFEFAASLGFKVDRESRTVEGLALPYNEVASKYGLKFKFSPGSLEWADDVGRVKMLQDHDFGQTLGRALALNNADAGLQVKFKVGSGAARDAALQDASDGILDGMSVGIDFDMATDTVPDPDDKSVLLIRRATLREVSLTAMPAFDNARVTKVAASRSNGGAMEDCATCGQRHAPGVACPTPATAPTGPVTLTADQFAALLAGRPAAPAPEVEQRPVVNPTRPTAATLVSEALPYRFDRGGNFAAGQRHVFSADLHEMALANDAYGNQTDAGKRVMGLLAATFDVDSADINEVTPTINRPDLYVDQREYKTPLWNFVNHGAPPNGIQPFTFPKFSSATGLVADHTEGTEPTGGTLVTTSQTVTPTPISGKAYITRVVWDMGGNPAVSTLIWNQMIRGWKEGLESATATFLNTLTAATDITLAAGSADEVLAAAWEAAVADLQFVRGYDFEAFALEKELYKKFAAARDADERPMYPILNPQNANGTASTRFRTLDLAGVTGVPSWALASTAGSPNNSWLFDPSVVWGFATAPQRLEFPGGSDDNTSYAPIDKVGLGIWGYKAFANSDIGGVRQVIYDTVA